MLRKAAQLKAVVVSNIISLYIKSGHFDLKQIVKSDIDQLMRSKTCHSLR